MVLFPNCQCCGKCNCGKSSLPYVITATASGFSKHMHCPNVIVPLAPCFDKFGWFDDEKAVNRFWSSTGPYAVMLSPGGNSAPGPLGSIVIGSYGVGGYARLGREPPRLSIRRANPNLADTSPGGEMFTPVFSEIGHEGCSDCLKLWTISAVSINGNLIGVSDGEAILYESADAETKYLCSAQSFNQFGSNFHPFGLGPPPTGALTVDKSQPVLAISVGGGVGGILQVESLQNSGSGHWSVAQISVVSGGSGYSDGAAVTAAGETANDILAGDALSAKAVTTAVMPQMSVTVASSGTGANIVASLAEGQRSNQRPAWYVSGVSVTSGGSGYSVGDRVSILSGDRSESKLPGEHVPLAYVSEVSETGAIQAVAFSQNTSCVFWKDSGVIESVEITNGGAYYRSSNPRIALAPWPPNTLAGDGGVWYRENKNLPACISTFGGDGGFGGLSTSIEGDLTVIPPNGGDPWAFNDEFNAKVRVNVNADPYSEQFGDITGIEIVEPGNGFKAWSWCDPCFDFGSGEAMNGRHTRLQPAADANSLPQNLQYGLYQTPAGAFSGVARLVTLSITSNYGTGGEVRTIGFRRLKPKLAIDGTLWGDGFAVRQGVCGHFSFTLEEHTENIDHWPAGENLQNREDLAIVDINGNPLTISGLSYWTIASVAATGGNAYKDDSAAAIYPAPGVVVEEGADVTLHATPAPSFPEVANGADPGGVLTGATLNDGGKYYHSVFYDGLPTGIRNVYIHNGGSGYALLGREQPSPSFGLSQYVSIPEAMTLAPSFEHRSDSLGRDYWIFSEVDLSWSGGDGSLADETPLVARFDPPNFMEGAEQYQFYNNTGELVTGTWAVIGSIRVTRLSPTLTAQVAGEVGSGASFAVVLEENYPPGTWRVVRVDVLSGGGGYPESSRISFALGQHDAAESIAIGAVRVGAFGAITAVDVLAGGAYYKIGKPDRVELSEQTFHCYRESKSLPPYVANVSVAVSQISPSNGSGAEISVTVDSDPQSSNFGKLKTASVDSPGSNYILFGGQEFDYWVCEHSWKCDNGSPTAWDASGSVFFLVDRMRFARLIVFNNGVPWSFVSDEPIADCSNIDVVAKLVGNSNVFFRIQTGGEIGGANETDCTPCGGCAINVPTNLNIVASATVTIPEFPKPGGANEGAGTGCEAGDFSTGPFSLRCSGTETSLYSGSKAADQHAGPPIVNNPDDPYYTGPLISVAISCDGDKLYANVSASSPCRMFWIPENDPGVYRYSTLGIATSKEIQVGEGGQLQDVTIDEDFSFTGTFEPSIVHLHATVSFG